MTHYRNGKEREYKVRDELIANGWVLLAQSGGSKGAADLVMTHPHHGLALVQVGSKSKALGPCDRHRLCDLADTAGALALLAIVVPRQPIRYWYVTRDKPSTWNEWTHDAQWVCGDCDMGFWGDPPESCWHGVTTCDDCTCTDCGIEARRP